MKASFVKTENVQRLMAALTALEERGAGEACLMVVDGLPGLGKTAATAWMAARNDCVFARAKRNWTPNWMLKELLEQLRVQPAYRFETRFQQTIEALAGRADTARNNGETFAVVIDEVDYISRSDKMLSTLRDLSDFLEIPFILVGMGKVRTNLKRFPQVTSRVGQYVEFSPLTLTDVTAMVAGLSEVAVAPDLIALIHRHSKGFVREVKEAIAHIERLGARHSGAEIGVAEMAGQVLLNDRATSKPIVARG